jgi:immune inhibitor A
LPDAPERDRYRLTAQLNREAPGDIARVVNESPVSYHQGREDTFWILDLSSLEYSSRSFDLRLVTPHAYWYVGQEQDVDQRKLEKAAAEFEENIYPKVTSIFGSEWSPGVDNDPHLNIINGKLVGAAGYFSSADEYPAVVSPFSNQREIIYININAIPVDTTGYLDVLSHELQHAVHWNSDASEDTWVNEGLSELAASLAGYGNSNAGRFLRAGPTSLVHWPVSGMGSQASYGAASLFMRYLAEHYGDPRDLRPLVEQPLDGIAGINAFLRSQGHQTTFRRVFADWIAANYIDQFQPGLEDPRYRYAGIGISTAPTELLVSGATLEDQLPQFAAEYIQPRGLSGPTRISFKGAQEVALIPVEVGPEGCWWSNVGDSIDSTLTRALDLSGNLDPTLEYQVWFELEQDWDYTYIEISRDGGQTWRILGTSHTSAASGVSNNLGPGYTGESGGWLNESVDLARYAGQKVLLRFQYVTDDAINGSGLCLQGFSGNAASGWRDGWQADGFVLVNNRVQQEFVVQVIQVGQEISVTSIVLDTQNAGGLIVREPESLDQLMVVVGAMADKTRQPAGYQVSLDPVE